MTLVSMTRASSICPVSNALLDSLDLTGPTDPEIHRHKLDMLLVGVMLGCRHAYYNRLWHLCTLQDPSGYRLPRMHSRPGGETIGDIDRVCVYVGVTSPKLPPADLAQPSLVVRGRVLSSSRSPSFSLDPCGRQKNSQLFAN
jgi:hypothetical protein